MQMGILSSRKSSLNNMWLIVITMLFCATFDFIYSLSVFIYYSPSCTPQRIPFWLDSTFKFMDRFIAYYLWLYPLLYTFWPSFKNTKQQQIYKKSVEFLRNNSIRSFQSLSNSGTDVHYTTINPMTLSTPNVVLMSEDDDGGSELELDSDLSDNDKENFKITT
jgi:hypothetical protein